MAWTTDDGAPPSEEVAELLAAFEAVLRLVEGAQEGQAMIGTSEGMLLVSLISRPAEALVLTEGAGVVRLTRES